MSDAALPTVIAPESLAERLDDPRLLLIDLGREETYCRAHLPGALALDYASLVASRAPVGGLLPDAAQLGAVFSALGLGPDRHVVAYDDEGGGRAARLLWTLDVLGHPGASMIDGGIHAWAAAGCALVEAPGVALPRDYPVSITGAGSAGADYILGRLRDPDFVTLDTRTTGEYQGSDRRAARGGHIPGAVHFEWLEAIDQERQLRLRSPVELRARLTALGVTPDKEVVAYCQTHHRSSHTYVVLKSLGYPRVRGYPGAWSDWGNRPDTPVEL